MRNFLLFFFSHRTLADVRWDLHMLWVRLVNFLRGRRRKLLNFSLTREQPVFLNLQLLKKKGGEIPAPG